MSEASGPGAARVSRAERMTDLVDTEADSGDKEYRPPTSQVPQHSSTSAVEVFSSEALLNSLSILLPQ